MTVRMTWEEVRARRLERHALSAPSAGARPATIVTAMAGVHAQVMSAAELGIALRIQGATRLDVREALWGDRSLVKTYGPRGTVHLLPSRDLGMWVGALTALPPSNGFPPGQRLTRAQTDEIVAAIGDALADAELTVDELTDAIVERTGPWAGELTMPAFQGMWPRWRQAHHEAGIRGVLCFGPNRGRKVTYTSPHRWVPDLRPMDAEAALGELVHAYLHAYGPSTPQRFAHWLNAPVTWANELFGALGGRLERVEAEGAAAWVAAGDTAAPATSPRGVRLLPYFDTYAYRVGNQPPELLYPGRAAERVLGGNYQVLLVDGEVAGLWHQRRSGRRLAVTVEPLAPLSPARREELDAQVERVGEILEARPELTIGPVTVGGHA
ncbi:winged helix DNA-binding domain-containing protein [Spirillospora sp. CA-255316]